MGMFGKRIELHGIILQNIAGEGLGGLDFELHEN